MISFSIALALEVRNYAIHWVPVEDQGTRQIYFDENYHKREEQFSYVMWLVDFTSDGADAERDAIDPQAKSIEYANQNDCRLHGTRKTFYIAYDDHMQQGKALAQKNIVPPWQDVQPGTLQERIWNRACASATQ